VKKVLFIVPHLSTGGLPQYTLSLIKKIINDVDVYCIEYSMIADIFVVQRKQIVNLLGDKFYSLRKEKNELLEIVRKINPDIIHLQEIPELFMQVDIALALYASDRTHTIIETSHDSSFNIRNKKFFPDKFALISEYQRREFSKLKIPTSIIEYDIEYKDRLDRELGLKKLGLDPNLKHILNVGLFTPRKNQSEIFDYAREMIEYPIQFHFVGNQADNFKDYWEPLIKDCPPNVKIWGERSDVDNFYSCMDLFLFTSRGKDGDKETSPLVIRESISYHMPSLIYNLPVYLDMYDKYENDWDKKNFDRAICFRTRKDAVATAKAMLGIDPNT
jgi:glycosyltransferase involved in cell wall biosynthesis